MARNLPVKSQIFKYTNIVQSSSDYSKKMTRLRNRIFNEIVRPTAETNMRVVNRLAKLPWDMKPEIVNYYPRVVETNGLMRTLREYGLFRDEHEDFKDEIERKRELRGKGKRQRIERLRNEYFEKKAKVVKSRDKLSIEDE